MAVAVLLLTTVHSAHAQRPGGGDGGGAPAGLFSTNYDVAQREVPDAVLIMARREGALFGYYFWIPNRIVEIEVNMKGKVVKKKDQAEDPNIPTDVLQMLQKKGRAKLPVGRLLEIAADNLKDTPLSGLKFAKKDDKLVFEIGSLTLDAETGNIIKK